ncbi:hypothetical protein BT69DRAFT_1283611 [Atractiella rhizophila]|nr:hypothetical protein BT69DRAFT_1283611 [Atractiella rhizophila]
MLSKASRTFFRSTSRARQRLPIALAAYNAASTHIPTSGARRPFSSSPSVDSPASRLQHTHVDKKPHFSKILIANRGEIACRVIRTAKKLGIRTVAVFSEADRDSMHVRMADEAYCIGPPLASESYLDGEKIIRVCKRSGAQAVHPGYGFLSENASFAQRLKEEGLTFIGPPSSAIVSMGSKSESKTIMLAANVPCVPGYHGTDQSTARLADEAEKIGYPVLVKAVHGGGGKGMKIVMKREEFESQLGSARREAMKAFGNDDVLVEKYLSTPRHVEVQVFGDTHGNYVHLFERDCSVQRRHQKIIEEAPAPGLSEELRNELGMKAVQAAKAVGYVGAGTVEFIMDAENPNSFYFMEMNTRLQVEHPVTEFITGTDLVQWQLEVAAGNPLPLLQNGISRNGHSFECRIYAENPDNNFLPDTGTLAHVRPPPASENVRLETGFGTGDEIKVFYDPLIAKLVVHGKDRTDALRILKKALKEYEVVGPHTNISFLQRLAQHPRFVAGDVETGFIPKFYDDLFPPPPQPSFETLTKAGLYLGLRDASSLISSSPIPTPWTSPALLGQRFAGSPSARTYHVASTSPASNTDSPAEIGISPSNGAFEVFVKDFSGNQIVFPAVQAGYDRWDGRLESVIGEERSVSSVVSQPHVKGTLVPEKLTVFPSTNEEPVTFSLPVPEWMAKAEGVELDVGEGVMRAPMPCRIVQVFVKEGQEVKAGDALVACEAMKTETVLRAGRDAKVEGVFCHVGDLAEEGKKLVVLANEE